MIRRAYLLVYYLMILLILLALTALIIAAHPRTAPYLAERFLKENGVGYSRLEGTLLNGVTLHDLHYKDALLITRLELKYDIFMLFNPTPTLKKISAEGTTLRLDKLPKSTKNEEAFVLPAFALSRLQLSDTRIFMDGQRVSVDLNASKLHYRQKWNVKQLALQLNSSYANALIQGEIRSDRLYAKSALTPQASLAQTYLHTLQGMPETFTIDLEAGAEDAVVHTRLQDLQIQEQNISLHDADLTLRYRIQEEYFTFEAGYALAYGGFRTQVEQTGRSNLAGMYSSTLNAAVIHAPFALPFEKLDSEISGDKEGMRGRLHAGTLAFAFTTDDYKHFGIQARSEGLPLSFIPDLPLLLEKNSIAFNADARLDVDPFALRGTFDAEGSHLVYDGSFEADRDKQLVLTALTPKSESPLWEDYPVGKFSPLNLVYFKEQDQSILNLDANIFNITLFKTGYDLKGWGNAGSGYFDTYAKIADRNHTRLEVTAGIPSVHTLMSELGFTAPDDTLFLDARADINATVTLADKVRVKSRVHLPWYILQTDTQTTYQGEDVYLESTLSDGKIQIDRYSLNVKGHHIYSQRPSRIAFDANGSLQLKAFWIYDNLLLTGSFHPSQMQGRLRLQSEEFNYDGKEGNITLKADIRADFRSDGQQKIEGEVTLLEGTITYAPKTDYSISDDVIIIQDIKPRSPFSRFVNIHINALGPIRYKTEDADIRFTPDLILWQEPDRPLGIYGMVSILDGHLTGGGKYFSVNASELYFNGSDPINPNLNLNIHHQTLNRIDIKIDITNTLSSPVIILSSNPPMSQNDIMSYILFGEPASSAFGSSGENKNTFSASSLLLATGLKQILNDTSGVNIDTLNILTNKEGTLGYEIGTRFSRDIRVLYKNDTVSSVILQYSLSRSIRLDIDVHETGQGVSILYVKDF